MRKGSGTKQQLSITIDKKLADKLKKVLDKRMVKTSTYIEHLLKRDMHEK